MRRPHHNTWSQPLLTIEKTYVVAQAVFKQDKLMKAALTKVASAVKVENLQNQGLWDLIVRNHSKYTEEWQKLAIIDSLAIRIKFKIRIEGRDSSWLTRLSRAPTRRTCSASNRHLRGARHRWQYSKCNGGGAGCQMMSSSSYSSLIVTRFRNTKLFCILQRSFGNSCAT